MSVRMLPKDSLDIDRIAFIGRTYFEYLRMFGLNETFFGQGPVLDCAAGPSSFAAEAHRAGFRVIACDLLYDLSVETLIAKGRADIKHVYEKLDEVRHLYTWKYYRDTDEIIALRCRALETFSADFAVGLPEGRYVHARLPRLPFPDRSFTLVLSSHFLFLYGDRLDPGFHTSCLKELVRVSSGEVRIFPIQGMDAKPYSHMDKVLSFLKAENIDADIVKVPFEFQKGSNRLLRLVRRS